MLDEAPFSKRKSVLAIMISAASGYVFMFVAFLVSEYSPGLVFVTPSVLGFVSVLVYGEVRTTAFRHYIRNGSVSLLVWYAAVFLTAYVLGGVPGGVNSGGFFFLLFYPIFGPIALFLALAGVIVGGIFGWLVRQAFEPDNDAESSSIGP